MHAKISLLTRVSNKSNIRLLQESKMWAKKVCDFTNYFWGNIVAIYIIWVRFSSSGSFHYANSLSYSLPYRLLILVLLLEALSWRTACVQQEAKGIELGSLQLLFESPSCCLARWGIASALYIHVLRQLLFHFNLFLTYSCNDRSLTRSWLVNTKHGN